MNVQCPQCGSTFDLPAEYIGKRVECPCGAKFEAVPMPLPPPPPPEEQASEVVPVRLIAPPVSREMNRTIFTVCPHCGGHFEVSVSAATPIASVGGDFNVYRQPLRRGPVPVELTAKKYKAIYAFGVVLFLLILAGAVAILLLTENVKFFLYGLGALVIPLVIMICASIAAWWDRG